MGTHCWWMVGWLMRPCWWGCCMMLISWNEFWWGCGGEDYEGDPRCFCPCWTPQLDAIVMVEGVKVCGHDIRTQQKIHTHYIYIYIYCIPHDGTQYDDLWDDWGKWSDAVLWRSPSIIFDWCIPAGDLGHRQYVLLQWPRILPVLCDQHAAVVYVCHAVR